MTEVFADAFYFIALLNPSDQHHAEAVRVTRELSAPLVTTAVRRSSLRQRRCTSKPRVAQRTLGKPVRLVVPVSFFYGAPQRGSPSRRTGSPGGNTTGPCGTPLEYRE